MGPQLVGTRHRINESLERDGDGVDAASFLYNDQGDEISKEDGGSTSSHSRDIDNDGCVCDVFWFGRGGLFGLG